MYIYVYIRSCIRYMTDMSIINSVKSNLALPSHEPNLASVRRRPDSLAVNTKQSISARLFTIVQVPSYNI